MASLIFTVLLLNDFISIYDENIDPLYGYIINILMMIYVFCLIIAFCVLYSLYIKLIHSDLTTFGFLKFQVHTFFILFIVISIIRITTTIVED